MASVGEAEAEAEHDDEKSIFPSRFFLSSKLTELMAPIKDSTRIKYVCLSASKHLVAMGTSTGVVYVYSVDTQRCVHVTVAETEGSVVQVCLSKSGTMLAYATSKGHVLVTKLASPGRGKPERVRCICDHAGTVVTSLCWTHDGQCLYVGDDRGKVSRSNFYIQPTNKGRSPLRPLCEVIVSLESSVIQIDTHGTSHILISTRTRTILCYTDKQQFLQIGKKPREGKFGACFFPAQHLPSPTLLPQGGVGGQEEFILYCSRPGSRLWEVGVDGDVISTHQFKQLLNTPHTHLIDASVMDLSGIFSPGEAEGPQSLQFPQLYVYREEYLLTCTGGGLYILHPQRVEVVAWTKLPTDIIDFCCCEGSVYLLESSGHILQVSLVSPGELVRRCHERCHWHQAVTLITMTSPDDVGDVIKHLTVTMVTDMMTHTAHRDDLLHIINILKSREENERKMEIKFGREEERSESVEEGDKMDGEEDGGLDNCHVMTADVRHQTDGDVILTEAINGGDGGEEGVIGSPSSPDAPSPPSLYTPITQDDSVPSPCADDSSSERVASLRHQSDDINPSNDDDTVTSSLHRQDSLTSLASLTSMSSAEFPLAEIDQEAVMSVRPEVKRRSKKVKASIVTLDTGGNDAESTGAVRKVKRQKSIKSKPVSTESPDGDMKAGTMEACPHSEGDVERDAGTMGPSPLSEGDVERDTNSSEVSSSCSSLEKTEGDIQTDPPSELPVETEAETSIVELSEDGQEVPGGNSRRQRLIAVKDRISNKVKTTTKSVIQNIKEKRTQITEKVKKTAGKESGEGCPGKELTLSTVDITALTEATNTTSKRLEDISVSMNGDAMRPLLDSWAHVLHLTLLQLWSDHPSTLNRQTEGKTPHRAERNHQAHAENTNQNRKDSENHSENEQNPISEVTETESETEGNQDSAERLQKSEILETEDQRKSSEVNVEKERVREETDRVRQLVQPSKPTPQVCYLTDPFGLSADILEKCSDLAQLCFSLGCHGNITSTLGANNDIHTSLSKNKTTYHTGDGDGTKSETRFTETQETKTEDEKIARFLRRYFFLFVDKMEAVDMTIRHYHGDRLVLWKSLVDSLMDLSCDDRITGYIMNQQVDVAVDILRSEIIQHELPLTAYLLRLYGIIPLQTLEFCAEMYKRIDMLQVYFIIKLGSKLDQHFIIYIHKLHKSCHSSDWMGVLSRIHGDGELRRALLTCLLHRPPGATQLLSCQCNQPRPGSHLVPWPEEDLLEPLLSLGGFSQEEVDMMAHHGYWRGYLRLCSKTEATSKLQQLILQLDDIRLVDRQSELGYYPGCSEEWKDMIYKRCEQISRSGGGGLSCLQCGADLYTDSHQQTAGDVQTGSQGEGGSHSEGHIEGHQQTAGDVQPGSQTEGCHIEGHIEGHQQTAGNVQPGSQTEGCHIEGHRVTLTALAAMMVTDIPVKEGLNILHEVKVPEGYLPLTFYKDCVVAAFMQKQQSVLCHQMRERIDTYTWSKRSPALPPQIAAAVRQEKLERSKTTSSYQTSLCEKMYGRLRESPRLLGPCLEGPACHWGVTMDSRSLCGGCGHPIHTPVTMETGSSVYRCGHTFHRVCSPEGFCRLCFSTNYCDRPTRLNYENDGIYGLWSK